MPVGCLKRLAGLRGLTPLLTLLTVLAPALAADAATVEHLGDWTTAEAGRSRVVAFRVEPADADRVLPATVADEGVLELLGDAAAVAGSELGFVRIRGGAAGWTTLTIADATLEVRVTDPLHAAADAARHAPRIVGPAPGAVVWGTVAVGVEARCAPAGADLSPVVIELPDGGRLEPVEDTGDTYRPWRHLRYDLDTNALAPGWHALRPVVAGTGGDETAGPVVHVRVVVPDPDALTAGEAEARYDADRPDRFRDDRMRVGRSEDASAGAYFVSSSPEPAVCYPVTIDTAGWYQVMLGAAGTRARGTLPTVGIVVDGQQQSTTNGRVLGEGWHRMAAGVPLLLDAGRHVLTPLFANDFFVPGRVDRNLYLDRIEVLRVADAGAGGGAAGGDGMSMMTAMSMAAMSMEGGMGGGPAGPGAGPGRRVDDPHGEEPVPLRVAFVRPLDGLPLPGLMEIEGRCWWEGLPTRPAPRVTLLVNDRPVATQRSAAPRFWVDPSCFDPGDNAFRLVARLDDGTEAATPVQTMTWPAAPDDGERPPARTHHRFSIHDDGWDADVRGRLRAQHNPKERRALAFHGPGAAALALPDDLAGAYDVHLELRGDDFEGPAIATVALRHGEAEATAVGEARAPRWWNTQRVGPVELAPGPKRLVVSFENDKYEPDVGDRNLWVQAVLLVETATVEDRRAPVAALAWPPAGHEAWDADVVVADVSDDVSLRAAELVVDGVRTGVTIGLNRRPGRVVLPLVLRDLPPGEHEVAIRAEDVAGNVGLSERRTIVVTAEAPATPGRYARAVRLLDRFAYGPDPGELAAVLAMGESAWLADRLGRPFDDPGDLAALAAHLPHFAGRSVYESPRRAVGHLLLTPNPARARFVLWAQNHFSTWIRKTDGDRKWREHVAFSRLGPATFDRLLRASAESPAMTYYLDQESSFAGRINENYAREIMELHTVGVDGGYGQADVTALARLLTGWGASFEGDGRTGGAGAVRHTFRFDPRLTDTAALRVFGVDYPACDAGAAYERVGAALEMLASHPATARFVSRKLAAHYVASPPPETLVADLAARFLETNGDMRALLLAIAEHPAFWRTTGADRVADPVDFAVRLARVTGHDNPWQIADFLQRSNRGLFDRPSPDGYPEAPADFTDSNALTQRWRLAQDMQWPLARLVPGAWNNERLVAEADWTPAVVDLVAVRLTGRTLGPDSRRAAIELLGQATGPRHERARMVARFVAQLPEASMR